MYGGGIYLDSGALDVGQTQIRHNAAEDGGGIYQGGTGVSHISNTLINNNISTSITPLGAGIRAHAGDFYLMHVTLALNMEGYGFHASSPVSVWVYNSIIMGNSQGFSAWLPTYNCNFDQSGIVGSVVDPQFVDPGIMTPDYHLLGSYPAIDA